MNAKYAKGDKFRNEVSGWEVEVISEPRRLGHTSAFEIRISGSGCSFDGDSTTNSHRMTKIVKGRKLSKV